MGGGYEIDSSKSFEKLVVLVFSYKLCSLSQNYRSKYLQLKVVFEDIDENTKIACFM